MKKIRLNTRFLLTEGIPELITIAMIPFTMLAYLCGWIHGGIETTLCAVVFILCTWSVGYGEWQSVRGKISKLHFGLFCAAFLGVMAMPIKLYAMTDASSSQRLFLLAIAIVPCLMVCGSYNRALRRADNFEEKDREHCIAMAGYKAICTVAIVLLIYSACFWAIYYYGSALSEFFGISRFESWQAAMNMLNI